MSPSKCAWKHKVNKQINNYWVRFVREWASLNRSLQYLAVDNYFSGRSHHLLKSCRNARETTRVHTKLTLATGTFILQTNRAAFNQNMVDPTCLLCKSAEETTQHFLLEGPDLAVTMDHIKDSLLEACSGVSKIISMIRKDHNHEPQTTPWHPEEEPLNHHKTPGRQIKQSSQLSLPK